METPALRSVREEPELWASALAPDVLDDIQRYEMNLADRLLAAADAEDAANACCANPRVVWSGLVVSSPP